MRLLVFIFSIFNFLTMTSQNSVHEFDIITIDGTTQSLSAYKGKKMLFVNTASQCGFTSQYEALQSIHSKYGNNLVIIGFPANNFGFFNINDLWVSSRKSFKLVKRKPKDLKYNLRVCINYYCNIHCCYTGLLIYSNCCFNLHFLF